MKSLPRLASFGLASLSAIFLAAASAGGCAPLPLATSPAPVVSKIWPPDDLPGLPSDLEAYLQREGSTLPEARRTAAMFRLAALHEERARDEEDPDQLAARLLPAIRLYQEIAVHHPTAAEVPASLYYLGHALQDSGKSSAAQQVWRALVCQDLYPYPTKDPVSPSPAAGLPQDHDVQYWRRWESLHPDPVGDHPKASPDDEVAFVDPFPDTCRPVTPQTDTRHLAEAWWQIGDYHFSEVDPAGGPFNFNRAARAYAHAIAFGRQPLHSVASYKLAWTYYKQERYEASVDQFIALLHLTDVAEAESGDPGTDYRSEAYTYIADALTHLDFAGPSAAEPFVPRSDVLDLTPDSHLAEQKLHVAIERVQDPTLIPQGEAWAPEIYKALVREFKELGMVGNAIETAELTLKRWPMDPDAPVLVVQIADLHERLAMEAPAVSQERKNGLASAMEARRAMSRYVGKTPWVQANAKNEKAIDRAAELARAAFRKMAANHTNGARDLLTRGLDQTGAAQAALLESALSEYRGASQDWTQYVAVSELSVGVWARAAGGPEARKRAADIYEGQYWLADAHHAILVLTILLGRSPTAHEWEEARRTALVVRDSQEATTYLQPAAYFAVDIAQQALQEQDTLFTKTKGARGVPLRTTLPLKEEGTKNQSFQVEPIPQPVLEAIAARDAYLAHVPPDLDTPKNADRYRFQAADYHFLYGHFDEARKRFEPISTAMCGKNDWGYRAWERLITMATLEQDIAKARALAESALKKSCAVTSEQKVKESTLTRGTPVK